VADFQEAPGAGRPGVHRAEHAVEAAGQQRAQLGCVPVRLAELHTGQDPQGGIAVPALVERRPVALDVERSAEQDPVARHRPGGVVDVLGEGDRGQPQLDRPGAGAGHVAAGGVPGPLAVHVPVRR
jgi:hypothetical protein